MMNNRLTNEEITTAAKLWRLKNSTLQIAKYLLVAEAQVYNSLDEIRFYARFPKRSPNPNLIKYAGAEL